MSKGKIVRIGIIGAGASGLAAAVTAGRLSDADHKPGQCQIDLFEKNEEPGKKLLATGNGKCNVTNESAVDFQRSKKFFYDLGIPFIKEGDGRMYPYSKQARSIRNTLVKALIDTGVNIRCDIEVKSVEKREEIFLVKTVKGDVHEYDKLIISTGGKAGIQFGSDGVGYKIARSFDINVIPVMPSLVAMIYGKNYRFDLKMLKGVRAGASLTLVIEGENIATESGEIQFTDYGISGICTFNLSRFLIDAPRIDGGLVNCSVIIDLVPDFDHDDLTLLLETNRPAGLKGIINEKIEMLLLKSGLDPERDLSEIINILKNFTVPIKGTKGWKEAQVTAGGISMDEVDINSMESQKVRDLYFIGEILDYDGPCGGFNLNWAWITGIRAGMSVINGAESNDKAL